MKYGSVLIFIGMLALPPPAQSEQVKRPHLLQAIIFESYITQPPDNLQFYDAVELPSNDFPLKFSRLFDPSSSSETIQLPRSMAFPRDTAADTAGHCGLDMNDCRNMLREAGYTGLLYGDGKTLPL